MYFFVQMILWQRVVVRKRLSPLLVALYHLLRSPSNLVPDPNVIKIPKAVMYFVLQRNLWQRVVVENVCHPCSLDFGYHFQLIFGDLGNPGATLGHQR